METDTGDLPNKTATAIDNKTQVQIKKDNEVYLDQTDTDPYVYGYIKTPDTQNVAQAKDNDITETLRETFQSVNTNTSIDFPYVSETPIDEYSITMKLFCFSLFVFWRCWRH